MERINETLKRVITPEFTSRLDELQQEVLEDPGIQGFIEENSEDISKQVISRSLSKLYEYKSQSHDCKECPSLEQCANFMKGYEPKLVLDRNLIDVEYVRCKRGVIEDERKKVTSMIDSIHMPKEVMEASLSSLDLQDDSRVVAVRAAKDFLNEWERTNVLPAKGLYIYGKFGVGKSYLLGALANELAARHIHSVVVYVPEFLREMKQAIQDQSLPEKVEFVKKAPVLMLDDIGAETMSSWTRDEIIGTILHYRMSEQLPTFMSSNFNYDELQHHLSYTQRGEKEVVKAGRIMERIKALTNPVALRGKNWRELK
ncbi:primosomal protein DnaI [Psychrobacillus sp. FSL K6-2684]|uniref:Primosomal protein DnaI n=1 Tax=Psychrobacillus faecigallinarum TaxID=2762235 RepID=A0ABR8R712_9BACI|nr:MULTISPECIES: primosomal protein DnaI [Psychrobacillus]MBD7943590.1 primosomal protein DnaI [Psychrobacillus faecigallinarum]QEY22740.1 primosomal protein DnaI [Psychrobacillus sp. AK 1817]